MKDTGLVSIILLNCNGKVFNVNCIDSILKQTYNNYEIIFVNNMSNDGSLEEVQKIYKEQIDKGIIKIVLNSSNTGFTGGNNLGVKNSSKYAEYICLLNNDTTVGEDWLNNLVETIKRDDRLGAVQSIILEGDVEEIKKQIFYNKKKVITNIFSGEGSYKKISDNEFKNNLCYTTWVHGCCLLYKKDIVDKPFEDYYFIYHEDTYFSYRLLSLGYKLGMSLNSFVNHYGSGTCGKVSLMKQFRITRNRIINYIVFVPKMVGIIYSPLLVLSEVCSMFCGNFFLCLKAEIKSILWIFNNRGLIKETHKSISNDMDVSFFDFIKHLSPKLFLCHSRPLILYPIKVIVTTIALVYYYFFYFVIYLFYR